MGLQIYAERNQSERSNFMAIPIDAKIVRERLRDYSRDNYLLLANVIKGVVLGTATFTAIGIINELFVNPGNAWPRVIPFGSSVLAAFVTYMTWGRGILLTNARSNSRDSVLPLLMGGVEVSLFAVLKPVAETHDLWHWWLLVFALHTGIAVFLVRNRLRQTHSDDFAEDLQELFLEYKAWMQADWKGARIATIISFSAWVVSLVFWHNWPVRFGSWHTQVGNIVMTIAAAGAGVKLLDVLTQANAQRQSIEQFLVARKSTTTS
jgi:hypothetical protein